MPDPTVAPEPDPETENQRPDRKKAIIAFSIMAVAAVIVFGVIFPQLVDWKLVGEVLRDVDAAEYALIIGLGLARYFPSGWVYSLVLPGLSVWRGTQVWVATTAAASTLPGFDLVLRLAMYRSYQIPLEKGFSGMFLSGIVEMSSRLALAIGAVTIGALAIADLDLLVVALIAAVVMAGVAVFIGLVLRSEQMATRVGARIDRLIRWGADKFGRQAPDDLTDRILSVRIEARDVLGRRWPLAYFAAVLSQAIIFGMLLTALRATGADSSVLTWDEILLVHGVATIITMIPIVPGNVGISELIYAGLLIMIAGNEHAEVITAGVLVYRLALWLMPIPIGWITVFAWQRSSGTKLFGGGTPAPSA